MYDKIHYKKKKKTAMYCDDAAGRQEVSQE